MSAKLWFKQVKRNRNLKNKTCIGIYLQPYGTSPFSLRLDIDIVGIKSQQDNIKIFQHAHNSSITVGHLLFKHLGIYNSASGAIINISKSELKDTVTIQVGFHGMKDTIKVVGLHLG